MNDLTQTLRSKIERYLERLTASVKHNDTSNVGKLLADYYYWKTAEDYAESKKDLALNALVEAGFYDEAALAKEKAGDYPITMSKGFIFTATITNPVRRLDTNLLQQVMEKSRYKVPLATSRMWLEDCKKPTKPQIRKHITEKIA